MANVSRLNILVTGGISGFQSAMSSAGKSLGGFVSKTQGVAAKFGALGGIVAGVAGAASLGALYHSASENIDATAKLSDSLGITTESLSRLQYAASYAGVSNEDLGTGIKFMLKNLAGAKDGSGEAGDAFKKLGLDAENLINMPTDQAFGLIADALNEVQNPAEKAALSMKVFGKQGVGLLPLLQEGSASLAQYGEEADKLGYSFNRVDAAKVEAANDAFTRVGNAITGAFNQLVIAAAPTVEALATKLFELTQTGGGLGTILVNAFQGVVSAVAYASDYVDLLKAGFYGFRAGALEAISGVVSAISTMANAAEEVINYFGGDVDFTSGLNALAEGLEKVAGEEAAKFSDAFADFQNGKNSQAVGKFFDEINAKAQTTAETVAAAKNKVGGLASAVEEDGQATDKVGDILDGLQQKISNFGTSGTGVLGQIEKLGGTDEQIQQAMALTNQLDVLEAAKKRNEDLDRQAKSVLDDIATPMDQYTAKLDELQTLLDSGRLTWDQYTAAIDKANDSLDQASSGKDIAKPSLIRAGSQEGKKLIADVQAGLGSSKNDLAKQSFAESRKQTAELRRIGDAVENNGIEIVEYDF